MPAGAVISDGKTKKDPSKGIEGSRKNSQCCQRLTGHFRSDIESSRKPRIIPTPSCDQDAVSSSDAGSMVLRIFPPAGEAANAECQHRRGSRVAATPNPPGFRYPRTPRPPHRQKRTNILSSPKAFWRERRRFWQAMPPSSPPEKNQLHDETMLGN